MKHIVVVGSLNMDFVVAVERLPAPGETVIGSDFQMHPGGKGANQAYAAGKLGSGHVTTRMIGRVGNDVFGENLKASLSSAGVEVSAVQATPPYATGVGLISVEKSGQNAIVVASGANQALAEGDVEAMRPVLRGASFVLFQLESPLDTVTAAMQLAHQEGVRTMLDPAPARLLDPKLLAMVDILTPNETEASILAGLPPARVSMENAPELAKMLLALGPKAIVLKLGEQGCFYFDGKTQLVSPAFPLEARDTTGAGDTFNGALAVALAEGQELTSALRFANAAAGISVTRVGAQASIPARSEVDALLLSQN